MVTMTASLAGSAYATASTSDTLLVSPFMQRMALPALFAWFGVIMGSWVGRIPALRDGLQLSHSQLSLVLLMGGLGAVLSFPVSSRLMSRFGSRQAMLFSGLALLAVLLAIGAAPGVPLAMAAVLMLGITASTFDVGMNAVAARQERVQGRSSMSMLHACVCAGGLAGVTLGSGMAALQVSPLLHFAGLVAPFVVLLAWGIWQLPAEDAGEPIGQRAFVLPRGGLALLGALGFLGAIAEGSIADWAGIFMKDHIGASDGFAPLSLVAFSTMMLISRMMGDRLKTQYGAKILVIGGALLAAAGLFFAVFAPNQYLALGGFAIAGIGLALVFPFVFSAAGREGTVALAGVATMTYSGSLMGPPLLGGIAHLLGLKAAMGFIGVLALLIAAVTARTRLLR
jgi:MFS family permease